MFYSLLADLLLIVHLAFILFVIAGAFLVLKWRFLMWFHLPAVVWGVTVEFMGWICPLTPWEQKLRSLAGQASYEGSFVGNYLVPIIYPDGLTHNIQIMLGVMVIVVNVVVYGFIYRAGLSRSA